LDPQEWQRQMGERIRLQANATAQGIKRLGRPAAPPSSLYRKSAPPSAPAGQTRGRAAPQARPATPAMLEAVARDIRATGPRAKSIRKAVDRFLEHPWGPTLSRQQIQNDHVLFELDFSGRNDRFWRFDAECLTLIVAANGDWVLWRHHQTFVMPCEGGIVQWQASHHARTGRGVINHEALVQVRRLLKPPAPKRATRG
jgi:hypothetical protein